MDCFTEAKKLFLYERMHYSIYKESPLPNQVTEKAIIYTTTSAGMAKSRGKKYALTGVVTSQGTAAVKNVTGPCFAG